MDTLSIVKSFFSYRNLVHGIAGGTGNAFGITVCYPLECARTRLQVDDKTKAKFSYQVIWDIYQEEGICGVYRGLTSIAISLFCSSFIYFFVFHGLKAALAEAEQPQEFYTDFMFGIIAGSTGVFITNPLWVINTRLKLQGAKLKTNSYKNLKHPKYDGIYDCLQKIVAYDGVLHLWSGTLASLFLVSNPAIQFMVYEALKRLTQSLVEQEILTSYCYFLFGAVSKTVATFATYPLQLVQTRIRAGYSGQEIFSLEDNKFSMRHVQMMYRGLESKLSQTVLTAALTLLSYEKISMFVFSFMGLQS